MNKLKTGDEVIITAGKDKGRKGKLLKILDNNRVIVENLNMIKKHTKGNPSTGVTGGIIEKEASLHASNVMIFNPQKDGGDRVGIKILEDGKKVRVFKSNQEVIDI
jgi:large subunit ribosomal protein L24